MRRLAAALALVGVLAACSAPPYRYVRDSHTRTAFRVPAGWTIFDKATMLGLPPGPQPDVPDPIQWLVGIDADPNAASDHILDSSDLTTGSPQGIAIVQDLSFTERDSASIAYLRNFLFPVDQLIQNQSDAAVVSYNGDIQEHGFRGIQLIFQFRASELGTIGSSQSGATGDSAVQRALLGGQGVRVLSPDFVEVAQKAFLDESTKRVYYLGILCSADCYSRNRGAIESAVDSWTVIP